eukprot:3573657-Prymnesium_polylepis.1
MAEGSTRVITDMTEQDLVNLRRTIYLTIMSSAGVDECAHKVCERPSRYSARAPGDPRDRWGARASAGPLCRAEA